MFSTAFYTQLTINRIATISLLALWCICDLSPASPHSDCWIWAPITSMTIKVKSRYRWWMGFFSFGFGAQNLFPFVLNDSQLLPHPTLAQSLYIWLSCSLFCDIKSWLWPPFKIELTQTWMIFWNFSKIMFSVPGDIFAKRKTMLTQKIKANDLLFDYVWQLVYVLWINFSYYIT